MMTAGILLLVIFTAAVVFYHLIRRKRQRALNILHARLDGLTSSNAVMRVIPSPMETFALRRAQSDTYVSMQPTHVNGRPEYEDIIPCSGTSLYLLKAQNRR